MIIEIGSFKFDGFYESVYNNSDMFISDENELKDELLSKFNISDKNFDVDYDFIDYDEYKKDVCKCFMENYIEKIVDVLPSWITEFDFFKFEKSDDDIIVISPIYYNYSTDRCYCNIETNIETLNLIKWYALNLKGAKEYIINNFTSKDGFISHIINSYQKWKLLNISNYEQNHLICLLDMLLTLSDDDSFSDIRYDVKDSVCEYEYVEPKIWYCNKYYKLSKFVNIIKNGGVIE